LLMLMLLLLLVDVYDCVTLILYCCGHLRRFHSTVDRSSCLLLSTKRLAVAHGLFWFDYGLGSALTMSILITIISGKHYFTDFAILDRKVLDQLFLLFRKRIEDIIGRFVH